MVGVSKKVIYGWGGGMGGAGRTHLHDELEVGAHVARQQVVEALERGLLVELAEEADEEVRVQRGRLAQHALDVGQGGVVLQGALLVGWVV